MSNMIVESDDTALDLLLEKVYQDGRHDFRGYRRGTVIRRLERRLHATGVKTYLEYMQFLDGHPEEYQRLAESLTIKVSSFFRSPYVFHQVVRLVLPELVAAKTGREQQSLKFWSTACARGEEPYSIAILLAGFLGDRLREFDITIHATDISMAALTEAQEGVYRNIDGLPGSILENYFIRRDESYLVDRNLRQMVKFSHLDLVSTKTPPFMNLDCVFCCNILIYLQKQLQERVLGMLHDSLANPSYLILGEVETPTDNLRGRLECLGSKAKVYKKTGRIV